MKTVNQDVASFLREMRIAPAEWQAAKSHMFEYHIFCDGVMHRIGRCRHEDLMPLVEEWVQRQFDAVNPSLLSKPLHVFLDGQLRTVLKLQRTEDTFPEFAAIFAQTSFMFGMLDKPIVVDKPLAFTWNQACRMGNDA